MSVRPPLLNYGTQPRKSKRTIIALGLIVTLGGFIFLAKNQFTRIPEYQRFFQEARRVRGLMAYESPKDQVVWDDAWPAATRGAIQNNQDQDGYYPFSDAPLFLHGRQTASGEECLVEIKLVEPRSGHGEHLAVTLYEPGDLTRWTRHHGPDVAFDAPPIVGGPPKKIFAGRSDPKDGSHFTIDFEIGGKRQTLDGWLVDSTLSTSGGKTGVKMSLRNGPSRQADP